MTNALPRDASFPRVSPARRAPLAAALLAAFAGLACAAAPTDATEKTLREQESRAAAPATPPDQRKAALEQSIETRRGLLAATTDPAARAPMLLDQAEAILRRLAMDGWDATALVGVLPLDTRDSFAPLTLEGAESAEQGAEALRALIGEAEGGKSMPDKSVFEGWLAVRDRRAPMLVARSALVAAGFSTDAAQRTALAERALRAIESAKESDPEREARRLTLVGLARRALGDSAGAVQALQLAASGAQTSATKLEAMVGYSLGVLDDRGPAPARAILKGAMAAPPFVIEGKPAALAQALAADALFRMGEREAQGAPEGPARDAAMAAAYAPIIALLDREDLGLDERTRQSVVFHRLNALSPSNPEALAKLPAMVAFAKGAMLMYKEGEFNNALAIIEGVTEKGSARLRDLGPRGATALFALFKLRESEAKTWEEDARLVPGIVALRRLAREYPTHPTAGDSMASACSLAQGLARTHEKSGAFTSLYVETLADAVDLFPSHASADVWRVELAQKRLLDGKTAEGIALLEGVPAESNLALYAAVAMAQTTARHALNAPDGSNREPALREAAGRVEKALARITQDRAKPQPTGDGPKENYDANEATMKAYRAALRVALRDPAGALEDATESQRLGGASGAGPEALSLSLHARASAEAQLGRVTEALATSRRLADSFPTLAAPALLDLCDAATSQARQAERAGDDKAAAAVAADILVPASRIGLATAERAAPERVDAWKAQLGESLARAGGSADEAVAVLEELIARRGPDDRTVLWLAEARIEQNEPDKAMALLRDLLPSVEQKEQTNETFWRAWSRALSLLAANPTPEQAEQARKRIALLRLRDASLGGEPFATRIREAEAKLNATR